jgi:small subunit ribosomal protein S6
MRHYEIVLIVHPDQSKNIDSVVDRYKQMIEEDGGVVHRFEDWGRRHLAYPIQKIYKAHYLLFNVEVSQKTLDDLNYNFRFNDTILRNLVVSRKVAITEKSQMLLNKDKGDE